MPLKKNKSFGEDKKTTPTKKTKTGAQNDSEIDIEAIVDEILQNDALTEFEAPVEANFKSKAEKPKEIAKSMVSDDMLESINSVIAQSAVQSNLSNSNTKRGFDEDFIVENVDFLAKEKITVSEVKKATTAKSKSDSSGITTLSKKTANVKNKQFTIPEAPSIKILIKGLKNSDETNKKSK